MHLSSGTAILDYILLWQLQLYEALLLWNVTTEDKVKAAFTQWYIVAPCFNNPARTSFLAICTSLSSTVWHTTAANMKDMTDKIITTYSNLDKYPQS